MALDDTGSDLRFNIPEDNPAPVPGGRLLVGPKADIDNVHQGLRAIMARAMEQMPDGITGTVTSGYDPNGHVEHSQHHIAGSGALDIQLEKDGQPIPNKGEDTTGLYSQLHQNAIKAAQQDFPDIVDKLGWGGHFETQPGSGVRDLMHFDLGGSRGKLGATPQSKSLLQSINPISSAEAAEPQSAQPKPLQPIGPFPDTTSAWKAAPDDISHYTLRGDSKAGFSWQPVPVGTEAFMMNPTQKPTPQELEDQKRRLLSYSIDKYGTGLDPLTEGVYNLGPALNKGLASILAIPHNLEAAAPTTLALNALLGHFGYSPISLFPSEEQIEQKKGLFGRLGIRTDPQERTTAGYISSKIGEFIPSMIPGEVAVAGLAKASQAAKTLPLAARTVQDFAENPLKHAIGQLDNSAMYGLGAGTSGEFYRDLFGEQAPGLAEAEMIGGLGMASRIGPINVAGKLATRTTRGIYKTAKQAMGFGPALPDFRGMSDDEIHTAISTIMQMRMNEAVNEAELNLAALGRTGTGSLTDAERLQMTRAAISRGVSLRDEVHNAFNDMFTEENNMWDKVNRGAGRDYRKTKEIEKSLRADYESLNRLDTQSYPINITDLISGSGKGSLNDLDQVGAGVDLLKKINQQLYASMRSASPNLDRVRVLEKLQSALLDDLQGAETFNDRAKFFPSGNMKSVPIGEPDPNLPTAVAFSKEAAALRGNPMFRGVIYGGDKDLMEGSDALARYIRQGPHGFDALSKLSQLMQQRYGMDGPGSLQLLFKDAIKQDFIHQVAPEGYVSETSYRRFMEKYASILSHPQMDDLRNAFQEAYKGEQNVQRVFGFGIPEAQGSIERTANKMRLWMDNAPEVALRFAQTGGQITNPYKATQAVIEQLQRDTTGDAFKGFKQMVAQKFLTATENGTKNGANWIKENSGMLQAINEADPGFLGRMQDASNPVSKTGALNWIMQKAARLVGAAVGRHAGPELGAGTIQGPAIFSNAAAELVNKLPLGEQFRLTSAVIADADLYKTFSQFGAGKIPMPDSLLPTLLGAANPSLYQPSQQSPIADAHYNDPNNPLSSAEAYKAYYEKMHKK